MNPIDDNNQPNNLNLPARSGKVIKPMYGNIGPSSVHSAKKTDDPAVSLIRQKISSIFGDEPNAKEELKEAQNPSVRHSKHQQYMLELSSSGKSLADIQAAWHAYYTDLPNKEKHEVWQEFYTNQSRPADNPAKQIADTAQSHIPHKSAQSTVSARAYSGTDDSRSPEEIKDHLLNQVRTRAKPPKPSHAKSLLFGLGMGTIVMVIFLFGFFNERFIAPFITPSKTVSSTPLIIDPSTTAVGPEPKIIIPKINVEIPVVYDEPSIDEAAIQRSLEDGVVHYPITSKPGEAGNGAIFGHSSNNILNKGKYKFAFVLLKELEPGDTFMVHKDGTRYVYKVFDKKIVPPTDLSVLDPTDRPATMTLITCDPPGTSINRLVVVGEQISPKPSSNIASSAKKSDKINAVSLPSDSPSLWDRIRGWFVS